MTTRQYARLVSSWVATIGLDPRLFGTHSLRGKAELALPLLDRRGRAKSGRRYSGGQIVRGEIFGFNYHASYISPPPSSLGKDRLLSPLPEQFGLLAAIGR